jgi:hypothetical protein
MRLATAVLGLIAALGLAGCGVARAELDPHRCPLIKPTVVRSSGMYRADGVDAPPNDLVTSTVTSAPAADGTHSELWMEVWANGASIHTPLSRLFTATRPYADCELCVGLSEGCGADGSCKTEFYAVQGMAAVSRADTAPIGALSAKSKEVVLMEWDFTADAPKVDGSCRLLEEIAFEASW